LIKTHRQYAFAPVSASTTSYRRLIWGVIFCLPQAADALDDELCAHGGQTDYVLQVPRRDDGLHKCL